jgi:hypothetical protein
MDVQRRSPHCILSLGISCKRHRQDVPKELHVKDFKEKFFFAAFLSFVLCTSSISWAKRKASEK